MNIPAARRCTFAGKGKGEGPARSYFRAHHALYAGVPAPYWVPPAPFPLEPPANIPDPAAERNEQAKLKEFLKYKPLSQHTGTTRARTGADWHTQGVPGPSQHARAGASRVEVQGRPRNHAMTDQLCRREDLSS